MIPLFLAKYATKLKYAGIAAVIALVLGVGWYIEHLKGKVDTAESDLTQNKEWLRECRDANAQNQTDIDELERANRLLADAVRASDEAAIAAVERARQRDAQASRELSELVTELESLRRGEPSCEQIQDLDIGDVCPTAVERLRERANADH